MSEIKDGGPAFPAEIPTGSVTYNMATQSNELVYGTTSGMSLRDWFAGKAMMMFVNDLNPRQAADMAYQYADEMIALRAKDQP